MNYVYLSLLLMIPLIGIIDYALFKKYLRCEHCGKEINGITDFIVPTALEFLFFIAGVVVGGS